MPPSRILADDHGKGDSCAWLGTPAHGDPRTRRPLDVPLADASADEVLASPAGALFCARAEAVSPDFRLTDALAPAVSEICRRLDGLPLAIEFAAARLPGIAARDLAHRLDLRFRLLSGGALDQDLRHRTLAAVIDWSYELLAAREARLFERLSVFDGPRGG